jgi:hypothetical protein
VYTVCIISFLPLLYFLLYFCLGYSILHNRLYIISHISSLSVLYFFIFVKAIISICIIFFYIFVKAIMQCTLTLLSRLYIVHRLSYVSLLYFCPLYHAVYSYSYSARVLTLNIFVCATIQCTLSLHEFSRSLFRLDINGIV